MSDADDAGGRTPDGAIGDSANRDRANGDGAIGDGANGDQADGDGANGDQADGDGASGDGDGASGDGDGASGNGDGANGDGANGDGANGDGAIGDGASGNGDGADGPVSGLRNPAAAVRGVGMGTLVLECIVLLLAIQPIRMIAPDTPGWALGVIAGLAAACVLVAGLLRRPWGWWVGIVLQVAVVLAGVFQYALFVLGAVFLAIWIYVLRVRAAVAKPAEFDH